ncbi:hypothetical protein SAMN02745166_04002 [Prosthecobacter debontii]|uniref:Uncharacterized protein n=1 Tax=Prosthecobacter debontii TaxID=48467 RepID=A0A1T4YQQ9_9BACT|nr:hypothetical protein [Prosthecobacter debontii]SKB04177.1 hypothetical protein SAMN02745166_04002 [Prosthecobacter debontii]
MKSCTAKKAAILSLIFGGLVIAIGMYVTDVHLAGRITPAQDEEISGLFGNLLGIGLVAIWVPFFLRWMTGIRDRLLKNPK